MRTLDTLTSLWSKAEINHYIKADIVSTIKDNCKDIVEPGKIKNAISGANAVVSYTAANAIDIASEVKDSVVSVKDSVVGKFNKFFDNAIEYKKQSSVSK